MPTAVRRLCGQASSGPSGVAAQSAARIRSAISPSPGSAASATSAGLDTQPPRRRPARRIAHADMLPAGRRAAVRGAERIAVRALDHRPRTAAVHARGVRRLQAALVLLARLELPDPLLDPADPRLGFGQALLDAGD